MVEGEFDDFGVTVDSSRVVTVASGLCYVEHTDGIKCDRRQRGEHGADDPERAATAMQITAIYVTIDTDR